MLTPEQPGMHAARMLAVLGPSGSGKSSAVMAGLLPRLQQGALPGSEHWVYLAPMAPGTHPVEALTLTLAPCFPDKSLKSLRENLEDESARGLQLLTRRLVKEAGQKVVLLVDQFEELFTQTASEDERRRFIDLLTTAVREPHGWVILLLTLRADLYDRPMAYPELGRLILGHQTLVLPMDMHEQRAAIKQPAALPDVQLTFEGNLVGDLLYEVRGQIGALPLLQFTLEQLFVRRNDHLLTYQAYTEIGGVKGALAKQAESTYAALPSEEHRKLARSLFLRLIDPGVHDTTRRRASLSELSLSTPEETELLHQVTAYFLAARLLTTNEIAGTPTIEVSHEALIREWSRLSDWLWEARDDVRLQQSLSEDAVGWEQRGKSRDRLYRGSQLKEARAWARRNSPSTSEVAFLRASATHRVLSAVSVLAVLLVVVSSIATAGWFLTHQAPDPTHVTNLQDHGPGSLRQALDVAPAGSTITFDTALSGTIMLTSELKIARNLTIRGPVAHTLSVSSGKSGHRVHVLQGFSVTISNLIFKDSTIMLNSFIYNEGTLTLSNSTVSGNTALFNGGGGIDNLGTLTLTNSTVSGNRADFAGGSKGGGIDNLGTLTLTNSTVSGNTVTHGVGGGIYNGNALSLSNSTVSGNSASSTGGGIFNRLGDTLTLTNSTVSGNSASGPNGIGGIDNEGTLTLTNSTVSGNSASGPNGIGGIKIASSDCQTCSPAQADLIFSTIYGNRGSGGADMVIKDESSTQRSQVKISNSIVAGDSTHWEADIVGMLTSHGYNLFQDNSGATFDPATSNLHGTDKTLSVKDLPSLFASPVGLRANGGQTWTFALGANSPAIDQVPLRYCQVKDIFNDRSRMYTDQRGVKRPDGNENACDIGAYENVDQQV